MTNPITPEVRAAMERLRRFNQGVLDAVESDIDLHCIRAAVADAMLSLFPPGMPEPVEMWADGVPSRIYNASTTRVDGDSIRGLFVPLERVGS